MCAKQCDVKLGALTDHSLLQNIALENTPLRIVKVTIYGTIISNIYYLI